VRLLADLEDDRMMTLYELIRLDANGVRTSEAFYFEDDYAAMSYALPLANGGRVEVWHEGKRIAFTDELPARLQAA
jgi:hypothetical protein